MVIRTDIQDFLDSIVPLKELKKRAALTAAITEKLFRYRSYDEMFSNEEDEQGEYTVFHWDDGGGQVTALYFTADDEILLLTFDHECSTNFYGEGTEEEAQKQASLYRGVPQRLMRFVKNLEEDNWLLNIDFDNGETLYSASAIAWFVGGSWSYSEAFDALRYGEDGGLDYCLSPLLVQEESLTEEALVQQYKDSGFNGDAESDEEESKEIKVVRETYRTFYN